MSKDVCTAEAGVKIKVSGYLKQRSTFAYDI